MRPMMRPHQKLQTITNTIPRITRIPPRPMPPLRLPTSPTSGFRRHVRHRVSFPDGRCSQTQATHKSVVAWGTRRSRKSLGSTAGTAARRSLARGSGEISPHERPRVAPDLCAQPEAGAGVRRGLGSVVEACVPRSSAPCGSSPREPTRRGGKPCAPGLDGEDHGCRSTERARVGDRAGVRRGHGSVARQPARAQDPAASGADCDVADVPCESGMALAWSTGRLGDQLDEPRDERQTRRAERRCTSISSTDPRRRAHGSSR